MAQTVSDFHQCHCFYLQVMVVGEGGGQGAQGHCPRWSKPVVGVGQGASGLAQGCKVIAALRLHDLRD